jgi:hypothetical protein
MSCFYTKAQNTAIKLDYDLAGNQIKRYRQALSLRLGNTTNQKDSSLVFNIYPNPTKDFITIEGALENKATEAKIFIYDITGSLLYQDVYNGIKKTYSLVNYKTGMYFLEIKYNTKQSSNYRILVSR